MHFHVHHHYHYYPDETTLQKLDLILAHLESNMIDTAKLVAAVNRLKADDDAAIAMLTDLRNQNDAAAKQAKDLSDQLAALQAGADTTAIQNALDGLADDLGASADKIEAAVKGNPAVPDLPPSPTPPPA